MAIMTLEEYLKEFSVEIGALRKNLTKAAF